ncbi:MAG: hypothetical protein FVQ77_16210 [Cytophagales bacterium]|nr:hypothetical protein [Cytophagales bacterium]
MSKVKKKNFNILYFTMLIFTISSCQVSGYQFGAKSYQPRIVDEIRKDEVSKNDFIFCIYPKFKNTQCKLFINDAIVLDSVINLNNLGLFARRCNTFGPKKILLRLKLNESDKLFLQIGKRKKKEILWDNNYRRIILKKRCGILRLSSFKKIEGFI